MIDTRPLVDRMLEQYRKKPDRILDAELQLTLESIQIESALPRNSLLELQQRLQFVRSSFLKRLSGKEFFVFETTFRLQLLEVLALVMP